MLVESRDDDKASIGQIWFIGIELVVCNLSPTHTPSTSSVDNTCVNLAERLFNVIMKSSRDTDTSCPKLNMGHDIVGVVRVTNVEPDKVIKLESLGNNVNLRYEKVRVYVP